MTAQEILKLLIQNMKNDQKNMAFLTNTVDKKINEAMNDTSPIGQLEKKEKIQSLLEHEAYCNARSSAFKDVQEWAEEALKSPEIKQSEKTITVSLESLMEIETAINAGSSIIDTDIETEIFDLLTDASNTVGTLITDHFTQDEIDEAQNN